MHKIAQDAGRCQLEIRRNPKIAGYLSGTTMVQQVRSSRDDWRSNDGAGCASPFIVSVFANVAPINNSLMISDDVCVCHVPFLQWKRANESEYGH